MLRFLPLNYSAQRIAKISSHQKFQSSRTAKICSRKAQKIANPQNKNSRNIFMLHDKHRWTVVFHRRSRQRTKRYLTFSLMINSLFSGFVKFETKLWFPIRLYNVILKPNSSLVYSLARLRTEDCLSIFSGSFSKTQKAFTFFFLLTVPFQCLDK